MNLSTKILIDKYIENKNEKIDSKYVTSIIEQKEKEYNNLFINQNICPYNLATEKLLSSLNKNETIAKLKKLSNKNFYDNNVIDLMKCFINSITFTPKHYFIGDKIREYFTNLKQIGDPSVNGIALSSNLLLEKDFFVIKAPQNPDDSTALIHECFVAFNGTNLLRKYIPNFSIIYGTISCSPPIVDNKKILSWCMNSNSNVSYAIYEKINNSISFKKYIKTCSDIEFIEYYLQILLALKFASENVGFTHYDLHAENILMRYIERKNFYIKYDNLYIKSKNYIPTFIDYGMSNITFNNENYGNISNLQNFNVTNKCNILYDCYKLYMFSMNNIKITNPLIYENLKGLFKFFSNEDLDYSLKEQLPLYYSLTIDNKNFDSEINIDKLINFCRKYIVNNLNALDPITSVIPDSTSILQCLNDDSIGCNSQESLIEFLELKNDILPKTFILFYDQYMLLNDENSKNILTSKFQNHILNIFETEKLRMENIYLKLKLFEENNSILTISDQDSFNSNKDMFFQNIKNISEFILNIKTYILLYNSLKFIIYIYSKELYPEIFDYMNQSEKKLFYFIKKYFNDIEKSFINNIENLNIFENSLKKLLRNIDKNDEILNKLIIINKIKNYYVINLSIIKKI